MNGVILMVSKVASSMRELIFQDNNQRPVRIFNPENEEEAKKRIGIISFTDLSKK